MHNPVEEPLMTALATMRRIERGKPQIDETDMTILEGCVKTLRDMDDQTWASFVYDEERKLLQAIESYIRDCRRPETAEAHALTDEATGDINQSQSYAAL